jgi:hypothetical protein
MVAYGASIFFYSVFKVNEIVQVNKYYNTTYDPAMYEIYKNANNSRVINLLCLYTGAGLGLYDFYFSISNGFMNIRSAKKTKQLLMYNNTFDVQLNTLK